MIFPAQASLIPVQVALARFLEQGGFSVVFANYPYWYLGTTPFRYLTGPVLPLVLIFFHHFLPNLSLFETMLGLVGISWVVGAMGIYFLIKELGKGRITALLTALFYLFGPIMPLLFRFSDGLYLVAFSLLPFALLLYSKLLKTWSKKMTVFLITTICFLILLDSLILPSLVLGMAVIFLAQVDWKKAEDKLKKSFLLVICSLLLATFWYTPGYWLTLLEAPSFGGKGLALVIVWLGKLLPTAFAFGLAIFTTKFLKKEDVLSKFGFYWLFVFGLLTLFRLLSDPDFWLDWSSYALELQMGLGILGGLVFKRRISSFVAGGLLLILWLFVFNKYVLGTLQADIKNTVEYQISKQLDVIANPGEKVFLSGTTAFWLNAFVDIPQVRGGRDQASVDPNWRQVVWEIRQGENVEESVNWLKKLNIAYLVVHGPDSKEYYHDFANPDKFGATKFLEKVFYEEDDTVYRAER